MDFADVKPSIVSLLTVTIMAVLGITAFKFLFAKFSVPYLSDIFAAV